MAYFRTLTAVLLLLLVTLAGQAQAEITAKEFLEAWRASENNPPSRRRFEMYIAGAYQGILWAETDRQQSGQPRFFCELERLTLTPDQLVRQVQKYLDDHAGIKAQLEKYPIAMTLLFAVKHTFPCNK